jgi:hypothetical protein
VIFAFRYKINSHDYLQISLMGIISTLSPHTLLCDHVNFLIFPRGNMHIILNATNGRDH